MQGSNMAQPRVSGLRAADENVFARWKERKPKRMLFLCRSVAWQSLKPSPRLQCGSGAHGSLNHHGLRLRAARALDMADLNAVAPLLVGDVLLPEPLEEPHTNGNGAAHGSSEEADEDDEDIMSESDARREERVVVRALPVTAGAAGLPGNSNPTRHTVNLRWPDRTRAPCPLQVKFLVPNVAAGSIIGKAGTKITEIQTQSNARMQVRRRAATRQAGGRQAAADDGLTARPCNSSANRVLAALGLSTSVAWCGSGAARRVPPACAEALAPARLASEWHIGSRSQLRRPSNDTPRGVPPSGSSERPSIASLANCALERQRNRTYPVPGSTPHHVRAIWPHSPSRSSSLRTSRCEADALSPRTCSIEESSGAATALMVLTRCRPKTSHSTPWAE